MLAAVSEASVSAPMLKRMLCSGCRRALQSTATLVTASGSAARQPNHEDAVSPLQLRPVDGEVGLVDQLVRIRAVLRIPGNADRHCRADGLARGLDVESPLRDRTPDALGDLHRLLRRCLRQEDRELLAA